MDKEALLDCWKMFQREHNHPSVDRTMCNPDLREAFVAAARKVCNCESEQEILWTLMGLRKNKKLASGKRL